MLDPKELRLGNLIAEVGQPTEVTLGILQTLNNYKKGDEVFHGPIVLTPVWETKARLRNDDVSGIFWGNWSRDIDGYFLWVGGGKRYVYYVHELQNLFYALTGIECEL